MIRRHRDFHPERVVVILYLLNCLNFLAVFQYWHC